jgi:hypothetical protein
VSEARRTLRYWIVAAMLERGCDPVRAMQRHHWQPVRVTRALSPRECREFLGPYAGVRFFPSRAELARRAAA